MNSNDKVSIVIPAYFSNNQLFVMTKNLIEQIVKSLGDKEIIVVDDASPNSNYRDLLNRLFPGIRILYNETNKGFAHTVNKGIKAAKYNNILLLNNDIVIKNVGWLKILNGGLKKYDMVAPAGGRMTKNWEYIPGEATKENEEFAYLAGWALLVKKEVFNKIGLMPTNFGRGYFEDVLFSYRAKKSGFKLGIVENVGIEHLYHTTFKAENADMAKEYEEKRKIFLKIIENE